VTTAVRPRRTFHRGSVLASGLLFDTHLFAEAEARRRILACLVETHGDVYRIGERLIVRFREPERLVCSQAASTILVRHGPLHSGAPLEPDEERRLAAEALLEAVVVVAGGVASILPLERNAMEDLSAWLDVSSFELVEDLTALGSIARKPKARAPTALSNVRELFGAGAATAESVDLLASLSNAGDRTPGLAQVSGPAEGNAQGSAAAATLGALLNAVPRWFASLQKGWSTLFERRSQTAGTSSKPQTSLAVSPARPTASSWTSRLAALMRHAAARLLVRLRLAPLIGRRQARYLAHVLEMFDSGDLDSALRHAIPLTDEVATTMSPPMLGTPSPRAQLEIMPWRREAAPSTTLGGDLFALIKQKYRNAVETLVARGEFEKAAFVLAELLHSNEEAVSFLERHGKLELAAQLAEARDLPPGLVVRQWFLAGNKEHAVRIARRTGAFGDAVHRLGSTAPEASEELRLVWADSLANAGAFPAAVEVIWNVPRARHLALDWLDRAAAVGGATGARMLVKKLRLAPESFPDVRERLLALISEGEGEPHVASALGHEVLQSPTSDEMRIVAKMAARTLLVEQENSKTDGFLRRLTEFAGDAAFRADVAACASSAAPSSKTPPNTDSEPLLVHRVQNDVGAYGVFDAAEMPDGRLLIALGELGAHLLSPAGKVLARFAEPTHRLVMSRHGNRAILVAHRGEATRLAKLDLLTKRIQPWCDAHIDAFASTFDGETWHVACRDSLFAIDTLSNGWEHLWDLASLADGDGRVMSVQLGAAKLQVLVGQGDAKMQRWEIELPSHTVRRREILGECFAPAEEAPVSLHMVEATPGGQLLGWRQRMAAADGEALIAGIRDRAYWRDLPLPGDVVPCPPSASEAAAAFVVHTDEGLNIHLFDERWERERVIVRLDGPVEPRPSGEKQRMWVRLQGERAIVFDRHGRVLVLCVRTQRLLREFRAV
jgi:MoxR-vWA-beta-propeller ternary system domain bpX6